MTSRGCGIVFYFSPLFLHQNGHGVVFQFDALDFDLVVVIQGSPLARAHGTALAVGGLGILTFDATHDQPRQSKS